MRYNRRERITETVLLDKRVDGGDRKLYQLKAVKEICHVSSLDGCVVNTSEARLIQYVFYRLYSIHTSLAAMGDRVRRTVAGKCLGVVT